MSSEMSCALAMILNGPVEDDQAQLVQLLQKDEIDFDDWKQELYR